MKLAIFTGATPYQLVRNLGAAFTELECRELFRQTQLGESERLAVLAEAFDRAFGLADLQFVTAADVTQSKPHPQGARLALERLGVAADEVVMIGDHAADMESGAAAGITALIGITAANEDPRSVMGAGAIAVTDDLSKIPDLLKTAGLV